MSDECKAFIQGCLEKDPKNRLGRGGPQEILSHPWFSDLNHKDLIDKRIAPEFKPKLSTNVFDVSNFDKQFTSEEAIHSVMPQNEVKMVQKNSGAFKGFDN